MLKEEGRLHCDHAVLFCIQAVKICFRDALCAYQSAQLLHLVDLTLICIAVAELAHNRVLLRHHVQTVGQVANIAKEARHILVQVECEERRL